jgi:DNA-binding LacI/PurR family transcriptional regulator
MLAQERALGIILTPCDAGGEEISRVMNGGIPLVAFDRAVADPRADSVLIDNFGAVYQGTRHLIAAGHRYIGYVGGTYTLETGAARLAGYESAMRDAGLQPHSASGVNRIEGGMKAAEELLGRSGALTALVVSTNLRTLGVLRVLRDRGLKVPDDIALITVDDPFWAQLVDPPLTTLAQPVRQMAEAAVELLIGRMNGERTEPERVVFDCELRVRRSCGTALARPRRDC